MLALLKDAQYNNFNTSIVLLYLQFQCEIVVCGRKREFQNWVSTVQVNIVLYSVGRRSSKMSTAL